MHSLKASLEFVTQKTPSGIDHPYYGVKIPNDITITLESGDMFARLTAHPALGHETIVPFDQKEVHMNVLIETESFDDKWEVQLWHNLHDFNSWEALPLERCKAPRLEIAQTSQNFRRLWFSGTLSEKPSPSRPVSFTLRFRTDSQTGWKWVQHESGVDNGQLLYQAPLSNLGKHEDLSYYFDGVASDLKVEKVKSDTPNTRLWSITAKATPAQGEKSGYSTHKLGLPTDFVRWFSLVRLWSPWLAPRQGKGLPLAEKDGILYSFLRKDGLHVVVLAISGIDNVLTVLKQDGNALAAVARNDEAREGIMRVVIAVGGSFEEANAAVLYQARSIVSNNNIFSAEEQATFDEHSRKEKANMAHEGDAHANWVQDWYDGFTFCTWNALGQDLTEEKISGALESLEKNGIRITNLIIDDGWQSVDNEGQNQMNRGWERFEASSKGFPQGLQHAITNIRQKYPAIKHIAVWHALLGYWGGISPTGKLAETYKTIEVKKRNEVVGGKMQVIDASDVHRMYDDFYAFLSRSGIDSVKTDAQFFLDEIDTAPERRQLMNTYLRAWTSSQLRHFAGRAISCMSQTPQILFQCQLPQTLPALPVRNSDDFFPEIKESHPWHVFCNANNALLTSSLNVLPDWDMFQTAHPWAGFHAAARCVSGGPVYVTDEPGKHDLALIEQMTARTIRDQTVVLRCSVVGRSVQKYIGFEEERLCAVAAYHGHKGSGFGVLGVFNCRESSVTEVVPLHNFMGVEDGAEYVVCSHTTGKVGPVMKRNHVDATIGLQVEGFGWEILHASPVTVLDVSSKPLKIANLGLLGKMTGVAAVISTSVGLEGKRVRISTELKALGKLGLWVSDLGSGGDAEVEERLMVMMQGKPVPRECVAVRALGEGEGEGGVVEVDVEGAWKALGLVAGWGNEVGVVVLLKVE